MNAKILGQSLASKGRLQEHVVQGYLAQKGTFKLLFVSESPWTKPSYENEFHDLYEN